MSIRRRINFKEKKEFVLKKIEKKKENETSETRYFVERDRNRRENGKNMTQTDFTGKKNDYKKGKQGDTQKEKEAKETKKKRLNKKTLKKNEK